MKTKNLIVSFLVLMIAWLLLNWTIDPVNIVIGVAISLFLSVVFCSNCDLFTSINLTPKAFAYTFMYLVVFIVELIKANIDVTKRVLSPSLPINPGIVKVKTKLKSKMARLILADSITATICCENLWSSCPQHFKIFFILPIYSATLFSSRAFLALFRLPRTDLWNLCQSWLSLNFLLSIILARQ